MTRPANTPKILIVTRNLPPLTGGMERLNQHICEELSHDFDVQICGPRGGDQYLPPGIGYVGSPAMPLGKFLLHNTWQAARRAQAFKPQIIYAGSGLAVPTARLAGRIAGAKVLAYLHGLDIIADHPLYRAFFLPNIRSCDAYLVNSQNTKHLAQSRGVPGDRVTVLHPGVKLPSFANSESKALAFRKHIGAGKRPILLSVGRLSPRKGIVEFIQHCMPIIANQMPDVLYVIIGEEPNQSALTNNAGIAEKIHAITAHLELTGHVHLLGHVDDEELDCAYFASQVHVFPVLQQHNDVEGFGMVAMEAAAHGLPTIGFAVGGVPDAVAEGISGRLIEPNHYDILAERVIHQLQGNETTIAPNQCIEFSSKFSWVHFGVALREFFHKQISAS